MTKLGDQTIYNIIDRKNPDAISRLIREHPLSPAHMNYIHNVVHKSQWKVHAKEILDHNQDISSSSLTTRLAGASRSVAERLLQHPKTKDSFGVKHIHQNNTKLYWAHPEYHKDWYDS